MFSALLAVCLLGAHSDQLPAATWIRVTDVTGEIGGAGGTVIVCRPFPPDGVTLVYTHSMFGGDVRERFTPSGAMLRRVEMTTANAAAADYYAFTASVSRVGDRFLVEVPPAEYAEIVVRVDDVGRHRLVVGDETIDLLEASGQAHRIRLDVVTLTWASRLWGGQQAC